MDSLRGTIVTAGDEEAVPVSLAEDSEESGATQTPPVPSANLVSLFKPDELTKIAQRCLEDFDDDVKSREPHMRMLKRFYELYAGITKVKDFPFQNAANVNVPLETWTILQLAGRLYDMLVPSKGDFCNSVPTRATDEAEVDIANRTEVYANWHFRDKVPDFKQGYDATIWQVVAFGDCFRGAYWDTSENRLCPTWIAIDDFVVPFKCKVTDPNMRGVSRYTWIRHMSLYEIQDRAETGEFDPATVAKLKPQSASRAKDKSEFKEAVEQVDGVDEPTTQRFMEDEDRDVLQQHRKIRFPDDPARGPQFDGKPHYVRIDLDETEEKILSIMVREEDDPSDARRFAKEQAASQQAQAAHAQFQASGGMGPPDPQTGIPSPMPPPPPIPPEPKPVRQRETTFFTHWQAFQSEGFYGLGMGHFVGPINEAMNTLFNQQIDRSTVNNAGGGIISRQMRFQRGPIDRQPGKYTEVDAPASAIKDGLQNWPMVPPDPDGRWFVQQLDSWAGRVSGAGDTLSGEPIGSNETARAAISRTEQATKQISVLAERLIGFATCDLKIYWRLFSVYLDVDEAVDVVDGQGKPQAITVSRDDFKADAKVTPTADARMASRAQRVSDAMDLVGFVTGPTAPPELSQNPAARRVVIELALTAMDAHPVIDMLGPPPGPPQPPPPKMQWEENAGFLQDHDQPVNEQDDDDAHLMEIQGFKQDPLGYEKLSPTGRKMIDNHERGHYAQKLTKERKAHEQQQQALSGPPGQGAPGVAPPPGFHPPGGVPQA